MLKKTIISGIIFSLILLVGCNGEQEVIVLDDLKKSENDSNLSPESNFLSELQNEIIVSITEQTKLDSDSIETVMVSGDTDELTVSVSFPKDVKVDDSMIQLLIEDSIKKVSEKENITVSEENITIKIEKN
ncbi:topoisomerase [Sporosarcina sp.]|uniref:topoisomerase n=1 Tax=Sporosarcina sp. TaxID=49982 RepID=UPI002624CA1A|nr:topoisomerase [Sporosarcina sp.]